MVWTKSLYQVGSQSSPKAADLTGDGVLDIVLGAGKEEMGATEQGVVALDGRTGEILWQQAANAHIVGSATFATITDDDVPDVIIGGRNHNLKALNGATGEILWEYQYRWEDDPVLRHARFNFYTNVLVPDQNADGYPDLLTVNGGNWDALPHETHDRFPGVLMLIDVTNGEIIAADTMPDGKESYMSPVCFTQPGSAESTIVFGTGGETMGGNLYMTSLSGLKAGKLSHAQVIASEEQHGFIAPPVVADITEDGYYDIIAMSHASRACAVDGRTGNVLWKQTFDGMECSSGFAVGYFTEDRIPDFFTTLSTGIWPNYSTAEQVMLDGKDGSVAYQNPLGCFALSSAVVYDINGDQQDEVLLSVNDYDCAMQFTDEIRSPASLSSRLIAIDFQDTAVRVIERTEEVKSIYATPWVGDLDADGYLDIVYIQNYNPNDLFRYLGMKVKRISTAVRLRDPPRWGEYLGARGQSLFPL